MNWSKWISIVDILTQVLLTGSYILHRFEFNIFVIICKMTKLYSFNLMIITNLTIKQIDYLCRVGILLLLLSCMVCFAFERLSTITLTVVAFFRVVRPLVYYCSPSIWYLILATFTLPSPVMWNPASVAKATIRLARLRQPIASCHWRKH